MPRDCLAKDSMQFKSVNVALRLSLTVDACFIPPDRPSQMCVQSITRGVPEATEPASELPAIMDIEILRSYHISAAWLNYISFQDLSAALALTMGPAHLGDSLTKRAHTERVESIWSPLQLDNIHSLFRDGVPIDIPDSVHLRPLNSRLLSGFISYILPMVPVKCLVGRNWARDGSWLARRAACSGPS